MIADPVGGPTVGSVVGVVEAVLVGARRPSGVGLANPAVQCRLAQVGVVVVGAILADRIGRFRRWFERVTDGRF